MLKADLHTHTMASGHGYSTLTENARAAAEIGLELIATTDHGPRVPEGAHAWYFYNQKMTPSVLNGVRLLNGCEANIVLDTENGVDLPDIVLEAMDWVQIGMHQYCDLDARDRLKNTNAVIRAMSNPLVDQLNHPGNENNFPLELEPIIEAAKAYNVIIELNNHSFDINGSRSGSYGREIEFALAAFEAGVSLSIGSDAHFWNAVGHFNPALDVALEAGIPLDYFVNKDAQTVLTHITAKRPRHRLDWGGVVSRELPH